MLRKLALALSLLIVVLLAVVAAMTVLNSDGESDDVNTDGGEQGSELDSSVATDTSATSVAVGSSAEPLAVACELPVAGQTPLLVVFENRTATTDDFLAQVVAEYDDGTQVEAVATADALRSNERRAVVPDPWLDSTSIVNCRITAIQQGQHVILLGQNGP